LTATARHFSAPFPSPEIQASTGKDLLIPRSLSRFRRKLIVAYLTPFLIIRKIGCPFPFSLRRRKASLTVDRLQQGEPSLFGSSSAQCQCGTLPFLVPIRVTLFTGRPHGSKKKRRSCAILRWSLSYRGTQTLIVSLSETKNGFVLSGVFP